LIIDCRWKKATGPLSGEQAMTDLSVVIGASTGLGYKLTKQCAEHGFDPIIAADEPLIAEIAEALQATGAKFEPVQAALGAHEGIAKLCSAIGDRPVVALSANAGIVLERALPDQESNKGPQGCRHKHYGPIGLVQKVARGMARLPRGTNYTRRLDGRLHARCPFGGP
jgi:uncharacterized protein